MQECIKYQRQVMMTFTLKRIRKGILMDKAHLWNDAEVEYLTKILEDIDGLRVYKICQTGDAMNPTAGVRDGRPWKKSLHTRWSGFDNVRYSDCSGSYECVNSECHFKKEYGIVNRTHFDKKTNIYSICWSPGKYVQCGARRYVAFISGKKTRVYHRGKHIHVH